MNNLIKMGIASILLSLSVQAEEIDYFSYGINYWQDGKKN